MKNKNIIITSVLIIFVAVAIALFASKDSFSIPNNNQISVSCGTNSLNPGGSTNCTLSGSSSGIDQVEAKITSTSGLTVSNFKRSGDYWNGNADYGVVKLYTDNYLSNFSIATFTVTANSNSAGTRQSVNITDIFYAANGEKVQLTDYYPYNITVVKPKSTNNNLSSLTVSGASFSFNANTTTYNLTVNSGSTYINATKADSSATLSGDIGNKNLSYGKNTFKIYVKSEAGATKTYTLVINRPDNRSGNNNLKSLSLSNGKITFSKSKTSYSTSVGSDVSSTTIKASLEDSRAGYAVGYGPRTVKLAYGNNTVLVKVIAQNGNAKTYTITINRPKKSDGKSNNDTKKDDKDNKNTSKSSDSNNKLKSLTLSKGTILFDNDKVNYEIEVPYNVKSLVISGEAASSKAKVEGLGKKTLSVGENKFEIKVIAENGNVKTYTLKITRKEEVKGEKLDTNNYLKDLSIEGYEFDFDKDTLNYEIKRNGNTTLNIKAITESEKAEVAIIGNEDLKDKSEVKVVVTAEDGNNREYVITVVDGSNILTAIGIFLIGALSVAVAIAYKKRKSIVE